MSAPVKIGEQTMSGNSKFTIEKLDRQMSLRETVTERLRTSIISGDLVEGELYSAPSLGAAFGVSATPVREAMMDLVREGLVETVKNKGFRITGMTDAELEEIAEIRLLVEPAATKRALESVPSDSISDLRSLADVIVRTARDKDPEAYLAADREFHARLLSFAGNKQLVELATSLRLRTRMYGLKTLMENDQLDGSAQEHHEMIDCVERGDGEAIYELMIRHINHARGMWNTGTPDQDAPEQNTQ
ncbi:GntR family transcriptional regulator [Paeniglutamicibacter sp. MACA_103]|uniref:GntR family transcriptional regulator n=1 Tax=Paeniglutamicibacter sp. MACA_103 TaxID=3377337 RepID=UPI00389317A7